MVFDVCHACGGRHSPARRCRVVRTDPNVWLHGLQADAAISFPVHELPEFDIVCPHCAARFWRDEGINCCNGGRLQLPLDQEIPDDVAEVILSAHVRANIRRWYSNATECFCHLLIFHVLGTIWLSQWRQWVIRIVHYQILRSSWVDAVITA
jgi:hypothetical protein